MENKDSGSAAYIEAELNLRWVRTKHKRFKRHICLGRRWKSQWIQLRTGPSRSGPENLTNSFFFFFFNVLIVHKGHSFNSNGQCNHVDNNLKEKCVSIVNNRPKICLIIFNDKYWWTLRLTFHIWMQCSREEYSTRFRIGLVDPRWQISSAGSTDVATIFLRGRCVWNFTSC